jgi:hypothetical protein
MKSAFAIVMVVPKRLRGDRAICAMIAQGRAVPLAWPWKPA